MFARDPNRTLGLARDGRPCFDRSSNSTRLICIKYENPEISYADCATIGKGESREKDYHAWSSSGGSHDIVRRPDFGSVVAREELVGIVGQCLCPSRKTVNCNERRRRRAESSAEDIPALCGGRLGSTKTSIR